MATKNKEEKVTPVVSYTAVVGAVLLSLRDSQKKDQKHMANVLGMKAVSSWSRIESGDTAISIEQLALVAEELEIAPSEILAIADSEVIALSKRGVTTWWSRDVVAKFALTLSGSALFGLLSPALAMPVLFHSAPNLFSKLKKAVGKTGSPH